jgi:superfamily II DNA or RNA helicase
MSCPADARVAALEFTGEWRHYQELALAAFQRDVDAGRRRTHIVAPPGSGKTLLGVEMVHRLAARRGWSFAYWRSQRRNCASGSATVVLVGSRRWVVRFCPVTRQANRSLTPFTAMR